MRIAILTVLYEDMIREYYRTHPTVVTTGFEQHRSDFDSNVSLWAGGWSRALSRKGWESFTITVNNRILQNRWALEHDLEKASLETIALGQLRQFKPDILWYDYFDSVLLNRIRQELPSIRLVLGWTGSALVDEHVLRSTDLVLSCAPEAVARLQSQGLKAEHLHHAFDSGIFPALSPRTPAQDFIFVGQIFRGGDLHVTREQLLLRLVRECGLTIFSPSYFLGLKDIIRSSAKKLAYYGLKPFLSYKPLDPMLQRNPYLKEIRKAGSADWLPYNRELQRVMRAPVYGTTMLEHLRQSRVVLNIHADSSPRFASNMRLFETTGAGACLLTDWKENLNSLFTDGTEIVSYRSTAECIERVQWLLDHPAECEEIAKRGHQRTLRDHTFDVRIERLLDIITKSI